MSVLRNYSDVLFAALVLGIICFLPTIYYFTLGGALWLLGPIQALLAGAFVIAMYEILFPKEPAWPAPYTDEEEE